MVTDNRRIKVRDASALTVDDMRALVRWCDNQRESWWVGQVWGPVSGTRAYHLTVAQTLALYHAANDADYAGMDEWASESGDAHETWLEVAFP